MVSDAERGRMSVHFIAPGYRHFIMKRIKAVKATLGRQDGQISRRGNC